MFYVKDPCTLNRPWILSKKGKDKPVIIPLEVTKFLKNYHIMAIEFLYHNYRKGMKGSILNEDADMNFQLQIAAFCGALLTTPGIILIICPQHSTCFWQYHLRNHGGFKVIQVDERNSKDCHDGNDEKLALIVEVSHLKVCEDFENVNFFSVIIENLDQVANKLLVKRIDGKFNVGLSTRSFYTNPDQKLQWQMMNWANPGCVGKLNDFYEIDNKNLENLEDNYRHWWLRLTWHFCESFKQPSAEEIQNYKRTVADWASENSLNFPQKSRKRKMAEKTLNEPNSEASGDSSSDTTINEVPIDKYVKLPSMDESPILTSIIKNFAISPEPIPTHRSLPYTQTQPNCSKFQDDNSVILSFIDSKERPSTSKSESEEFIINLLKKPESEPPKDIENILNKADAVLQN